MLLAAHGVHGKARGYHNLSTTARVNAATFVGELHPLRRKVAYDENCNVGWRRWSARSRDIRTGPASLFDNCAGAVRHARYNPYQSFTGHRCEPGQFGSDCRPRDAKRERQRGRSPCCHSKERPASQTKES